MRIPIELRADDKLRNQECYILGFLPRYMSGDGASFDDIPQSFETTSIFAIIECNKNIVYRDIDDITIL